MVGQSACRPRRAPAVAKARLMPWCQSRMVPPVSKVSALMFAIIHNSPQGAQARGVPYPNPRLTGTACPGRPERDHPAATVRSSHPKAATIAYTGKTINGRGEGLLLAHQRADHTISEWILCIIGRGLWNLYAVARRVALASSCAPSCQQEAWYQV